MVVVPPSVHESGSLYRWLTEGGGPPDRGGLPVAPSWLLERLVSPAPSGPGGVGADVDGELLAASSPAGVSDAGADALVGAHLAAVRGAASGTRNDVLNQAAFCLGQLDGAGRINTDGVRAGLWDACAGYRADDGDEAARLTIASGWAAGKGSPLYRKPPLKGQTRSDRPASRSTPGEGALGGYCLDGPSALGLEPLADARRLLDGYPDRLLVVLGAGRDGAGRRLCTCWSRRGCGCVTRPGWGAGTARPPGVGNTGAGGSPRARLVGQGRSRQVPEEIAAPEGGPGLPGLAARPGRAPG